MNKSVDPKRAYHGGVFYRLPEKAPGSPGVLLNLDRISQIRSAYSPLALTSGGATFPC